MSNSEPDNFLQAVERLAAVEYEKLCGDLLAAIGPINTFDPTPRVQAQVDRAMEAINYKQRLNAIVLNASVKAANHTLGAGFQVKTDQYVKWRMGETYNGVTLSQTLRKNAVETSEILTGTIKEHVKAGGTWTQLAQKIQTHDKVADVAETLADLAKAGKKLGANPQEINKLARRAQNYINKLSPNDAPTKYLQNAYQKLIDTVQGGAGKEAVNRALGEAMDAKIKYNAERISRTELSRAHAEAFHAKYDDDERVTGYKWLLSSRHHITDECTMLAELDNGAGKGVYRKEDFPVQPAHPNCMCMLGVHVGDVPKKTEFRTVRDYLKGLPANERADIIGKANAAHETLYRRGLDKRNIHFGEEPRRIPEELIETVPEENQEKDLDSGGEKRILDKGLYPDELAGVKRGERNMTWDEADHGKGNPNYRPFGGDEGYRKNCQTCVVVHEARLRGYDVQALPNLKTPGNASFELSNRTETAWIDPNTGTYPKSFSFSAKTAKEWSQDLDGLVQKDERYTIRFAWKDRKNAKHIISVDRTEDGKLRFHDPQTNETFIGVDGVRNYLKEVKLSDYPMLTRVDNMQFNIDVVNNILKGIQ